MQLLPLNYESVTSVSTGNNRTWLVYDLLHCKPAIIKIYIYRFQLPVGCMSTKQDERLRERGGTYKLMRKSGNSEMFNYMNIFKSNELFNFLAKCIFFICASWTNVKEIAK